MAELERRPVAAWVRWLPGLTLLAVLTTTASAEYELARTVLGLQPWIAWAVPVAIDSYVLAALRSGRDVGAAMTVMAAALSASMGAHLAAVDLAPGERLPVEVTGPASAVIMSALVVVAWRVHVLIDGLQQPSPAPAGPGRRAAVPPVKPAAAVERPAAAPVAGAVLAQEPITVAPREEKPARAAVVAELAQRLGDGEDLETLEVLGARYGRGRSAMGEIVRDARAAAAESVSWSPSGVTALRGVGGAR